MLKHSGYSPIARASLTVPLGKSKGSSSVTRGRRDRIGNCLLLMGHPIYVKNVVPEVGMGRSIDNDIINVSTSYICFSDPLLLQAPSEPSPPGN